MTYQVKLATFEGPLDLLLYLIKKEEVDIYDIPIAKILEQYMEYMDLFKMLDINIAGEFIVMASTLMLIKSKMLLPNEEVEDGDLDDPRTDLVAQLLEYRKFNEAADYFSLLEEKQSNIFSRTYSIKEDLGGDLDPVFEVSLFDLMDALSSVLQSAKAQEVFQEIVDEEIKVEDKIAEILARLQQENNFEFRDLFKNIKNINHIIALFLAILELIKIKKILVFQNEKFGNFFLKKL
jgi:segregation and condensation protein A